jgi:hypothetical protein
MGFVKFYRWGWWDVAQVVWKYEYSSCAFCMVLVGLSVYSPSVRSLWMGVLVLFQRPWFPLSVMFLAVERALVFCFFFSRSAYLLFMFRLVPHPAGCRCWFNGASFNICGDGIRLEYVCRTVESRSFVVVVPPLRQWFCPAGYVDGDTFGSICELCLACDRGVSSLITPCLLEYKDRACYSIDITWSISA